MRGRWSWAGTWTCTEAMARVLTAVLLAAAVAPAAASDLPEIKRRGTLRLVVAGDPDNPRPTPSAFIRHEGGQLAGLEGELLAGFARLHGVQVETVYVPSWDKLIPAIAQDRGDVAAGGITDTPARRQLVDFTVETFPTRTVVVTRRPHRVVRTLAELREEKVGVSRGTSYVEAVRAAGVPKENLDDSYVAPALSARTALKEGRITAMVEGIEVALSIDAGDPDLQIGMFLGPPESLALAVRKEDKQLLAALDEYVTNIRRTGSWNRLVVKYFGEKTLDVLKVIRQPSP